MKNWTLTLLGLLIGFFLFPYISNAQSISGSVGTLEEADFLGYANVDIYKGDELVASVLADKDGNFNVKLDTGTYICEIKFAGYKSIKKEFKVLDDEKADFDLKKDAKSKYKAPKEYKYESAESDKSYSYTHDLSPDMVMSDISVTSTLGTRSKRMPAYKPSKSILPPDDGKEIQVGPGKLTAGEINDFSKWELWTDIVEGELGQHQERWKFNPQNRFMVQVTDNTGLPLADLTVQLVNNKDVIVYQARTDNTGKAELWQSLSTEKLISAKHKILVFHKAGKELISRAKPFERGLNKVVLEADCNQSQKVDIAFVVDATGSMSDELNFLKAELNEVIFQSKNISSTLNFSFANVFYRDKGDAYLTKTQDFTRVLSESISFISDQQAGGGGDYPEAVESALDTAINTLSWSKYARARLLFLVLDAPPHNNPEVHKKMKELSKQAAEKGIRIIPLVASGINKSAEYLMRSVALATNGTYAFLTDHSGIGGKHLAPSTDEYEVEMLNNLLVRVIKGFTYMPDCQQQLPELDLNLPDSGVVYTPPQDTANTDSVVQEPVNISWKYYPNPTRGIVMIKADVAILELYVTDLSGKVLRVVKNIEAEVPVRVDLSGYASGIYLIRYPASKQWVSGKVVLIRD